MYNTSLTSEGNTLIIVLTTHRTKEKEKEKKSKKKKPLVNILCCAIRCFKSINSACISLKFKLLKLTFSYLFLLKLYILHIINMMMAISQTRVKSSLMIKVDNS